MPFWLYWVFKLNFTISNPTFYLLVIWFSINQNGILPCFQIVSMLIFGFQWTKLGPSTVSRCHKGTPAPYLLLANRDLATAAVYCTGTRIGTLLLPRGALSRVSILVLGPCYCQWWGPYQCQYNSATTQQAPAGVNILQTVAHCAAANLQLFVMCTLSQLTREMYVFWAQFKNLMWC